MKIRRKTKLDILVIDEIRKRKKTFIAELAKHFGKRPQTISSCFARLLGDNIIERSSPPKGYKQHGTMPEWKKLKPRKDWLNCDYKKGKR